MGPLIEELTRREAAARAEADRLRARIEELSGDLARAEEQALRLAITREEVMRVLEEPPAANPAWQGGGPGGVPGPASPIEAVTVPPWHEGAGASVLPQAYQDLLEVAADAGRPLRAGGTRTPWRSWPRSRRPAGPSTARTPRSAAAAGRSSASGRSRKPR